MFIRSNIRFLTRKKRITYTKLGKMANFSNGYIYCYLNKHVKEENMKINKLNTIAKLLDVTLDDLVKKDLRKGA